MIVVIIAGGSGTRLWPLSTPDYPKHLLAVNGDTFTLLQHTYERAKLLTDKIYVASEVSHIAHVKQQLPELPDDHFIVEPARRGTANVLAAVIGYLEKRHGSDEVVASMAADHYIRDSAGFRHSFRVAETVAQQHQRLVLVGVEPDHPSTGFGYIEKGELLDEAQFVFNVRSFKEKPAAEVAQKYLETGNYLWNCSYFLAPLATFTQLMQQYGPSMFAAYQKLAAAAPDEFSDLYKGLEAAAVDYALIENVPDLLVVPASFDWMDLGSFSDMYKAACDYDSQGNHVTGAAELADVSNSFVHNKGDKPVAVIGLDNVAVINTPEGILVTRLDTSQKVGEVSKRITSG